MCGCGAVGSASAAGITGFPTVGNNADRIGTTSEVIGSAEFPLIVDKNCGAVARRNSLQVMPRVARADIMQFLRSAKLCKDS